MCVVYLMTEGSKARMEGGRIIVEKDGKKLSSVPLERVTSVVLGVHGHMTTEAMAAVLKQKGAITLVNKCGEIQGCMEKGGSSIQRLMQQMDCFENPEHQVELIRYILRAKLTGQAEILRRASKRKNATELKDILKKIYIFRSAMEKSVDPEKLRGIEGITAKLYFSAFPFLLNAENFPWQGRLRRPPRDPVNAMLSFCYALLEREVRTALAGERLDARVGFFHSNNGRKDSLVYDVMELFRQPVADRLVLKLLNLGVFKPENFVTDDKGCRFMPQELKRFLSEYEKHMNQNFQEYQGQTPRAWIRAQVSLFATMVRRLANDEALLEKSA